MQKLIKIVAVLSLLMAIPLTSNAQTGLTDIDNNEYSTAIMYLYDNQVISGDDDANTFRPNDGINRAEFAKVAILTLGIEPTDKPDGCFDDVNVPSWYRKWVCTAKDNLIVTGHGDGSFYKPGNDISRAEAITIICRALGWDQNSFTGEFTDIPNSDWYSGCANYAKANNLLPFINNEFKPSSSISRSQFSEVIFRAVQAEQKADENALPHLARIQIADPEPEPETPPTETITPEPDPEIDVTPSETSTTDEDASYNRNLFSGIRLDDPFPSNFYQNEIYEFTGKLTSNNFDNLFLFYFAKGEQNNIKTISANLDKDGNFRLPFYFDQEPGTYYIGIIPGSSGNSIVAEIVISDELPPESDEISTPSTPETTFSYTNDLSSMSVSETAEISLTEHTFTRGNNTVKYYTRQTNQPIALRYKDFTDFTSGRITVNSKSTTLNNLYQPTSRSNWSSANESRFTGTEHYYSSISENIQLDNLPEFSDENIVFSGITDIELSGTMSIITPEGSVTDIEVYNSPRSPGSSFTYEYDVPNTNETYIIEVNDTSGLAVINHPIYAEDSIPIIPDYFDLNQISLDPDAAVSLETDRNTLLNLINDKRSELDLDPVDLRNDLNNAGQAHTDDMATQDYFAHNSLDGSTPQDRAADAGIETIVGENIVKTASIEQGHELLIRSAIHLNNILQPYWTHVGIGITTDAEGYYYIAQEFTTAVDEVGRFLEDGINLERQTNLIFSNDLSDAAEAWTNKMITEDFFAPNTDDQSISDYLEPERSYQSIRVLVIKSSNVSQILANIFDNSDIADEQWNYAGIGVGIDPNTSAFLLTFIYGES